MNIATHMVDVGGALRELCVPPPLPFFLSYLLYFPIIIFFCQNLNCGGGSEWMFGVVVWLAQLLGGGSWQTHFAPNAFLHEPNEHRLPRERNAIWCLMLLLCF